MKLQGTTALVTGANPGLGRHIAQQLRDHGVHLYAAARRPEAIDLDDVTALQLDIMDPTSVAAAAATAKDVSILVNNAGVATGATLVGRKLNHIRHEFETNFFGTLAVHTHIRRMEPAQWPGPGVYVNLPGITRACFGLWF